MPGSSPGVAGAIRHWRNWQAWLGLISRRAPATTVESGVHYHQRDYKTLVEVSLKFITDNPDAWPGHYVLAVGYDGLGRGADAVPEYQKAVKLSHGDTDTVAGLAHGYIAIGKRVEAEKILHGLLNQPQKSYVSPYMIATIYAGLGDKKRRLTRKDPPMCRTF